MTYLIADIKKGTPDYFWEEEHIRWKDDGRPALDETSEEQILNWFEQKLIALDEHFNYNGNETP